MNSSSQQPASGPELDVLLHDGPCIFVNKPGGILTQAPPGIDSLEIRVKSYLREKEKASGKIYTGVPHRLDRPAAGVMVFTRHLRATQRIAAQFEKRTVTKKYWALVSGQVELDQGTWVDHMRKIPDEAKSEIVSAQSEKAQEAVLDFRVCARQSNQTWLEIELHTGRTHQIRLQAASRGHPILGDHLYGSTCDFGPDTQDLRARWIALLARNLELRHPMEDRRVEVTAPLPSHWLEAGDFDFDSIAS